MTPDGKRVEHDSCIPPSQSQEERERVDIQSNERIMSTYRHQRKRLSKMPVRSRSDHPIIRQLVYPVCPSLSLSLSLAWVKITRVCRCRVDIDRARVSRPIEESRYLSVDKKCCSISWMKCSIEIDHICEKKILSFLSGGGSLLFFG